MKYWTTLGDNAVIQYSLPILSAAPQSKQAAEYTGPTQTLTGAYT